MRMPEPQSRAEGVQSPMCETVARDLVFNQGCVWLSSCLSEAQASNTTDLHSQSPTVTGATAVQSRRTP